ncbi:unnamed protein product [Gongylonema pulchrum]|uniref:Uncharacterized protein n=1 Tax=Gongylonema pulchrum TaxID=637853 RepID=A0A183DBN3_9BILA|nr:unnamed protein product [Gongylonema pulchrum]
MREFNEFFLPPNIYTQDAEQYSSQALRQRQMQQMEKNGGSMPFTKILHLDAPQLHWSSTQSSYWL